MWRTPQRVYSALPLMETITMNPDTPNTPNIPILMITMQIPVQDDTNAAQVLEAIGPQLAEALEQIKRQANAPDPEAIPQVEFNASVLRETEETFSDDTHDDWLTALGYAA
jgi:hypothetical protein